MNSVIVRYVLKNPCSFLQVDEKLDLALLSMEKTTAAEGWGQVQVEEQRSPGGFKSGREVER